MSSLHLEGIEKIYGRAETGAALTDLTLSVAQGEFFVLVGESGSGKSTALRIIAGLVEPTSGTVRLGDRVVTDARGSVPPERRGVGLVFQDSALFPHLSVERNIAYGLRTSREEKKARVAALLSRVGLSSYERRMPHTLSGGEQQRVALARALAPDPAVLLLDEPFSNLDVSLRDELRQEVRRILKDTGTTTVLVTHDTEEALGLGDRIGAIHRGVLHQVGSPRELYERPLTREVATLFGRTNLLAGEITERGVKTPLGVFPLPAGSTPRPGSTVSIAIRPEKLRFVRSGGVEGTVVHTRFLGHGVLTRVNLGPLEVWVQSGELPLAAGERVRVEADPAGVTILQAP